MAYNKYYYLHAARMMQKKAAPYLEYGRSLYWIWKHVQLPHFPISYQKFVDMMSEPRIEHQLCELEKIQNERFKV